jgi:hypothetical protein
MRNIYTLITVITIIIIQGCSSTSKTGIEGDNNEGNAVAIGDHNVIISEGNNSSVGQVEIKGEWDQQQAQSLVAGILNANLDSVKNDYTHQILNFYNMDYGTKQAIIAVTYSKPKHGESLDGKPAPYDCHACGGKMSFIEFVKYPNGWKIENKYLQIVDDGQWGGASDNWKLLNIGYNKFAFVLEAGGTGQGYTEVYTSIYAFVGSGFKEIFNVETGYDDSGTKDPSENNYDSNIRVVKEGTGFYDIEVTKKGIENSQPFEKVSYFKFDGIKYSESNNLK